MLTVVTFKWRSAGYSIKYTAEHVNILEAMVRRNHEGPVRFVCITDDPTGVRGETFPLWQDCASLHNASGTALPSCYRRLKLFDPSTQAELGMKPGDRVVSLDLDTVITGKIDSLFDRADDFVGWALPGTFRPRVFNGSMWMLRAGAEAHVWRDFNPEVSPREANEARFLGSDQAWMSYRLQGRAGWTDEDGVYSYPQAIRRGPLPEDARVVMFHGFRKPWMAGHPDWVREHYRGQRQGRCLVLGYGPSLWRDAEAAIGKPFNGVIASPEAAELWPGPVDAIAQTDDEAERMADMLGFEEIAFCGRAEGERAA